MAAPLIASVAPITAASNTLGSLIWPTMTALCSALFAPKTEASPRSTSGAGIATAPLDSPTNSAQGRASHSPMSRRRARRSRGEAIVLIVDALAGLDAGIEGMFDIAHFRDRVHDVL